MTYTHFAQDLAWIKQPLYIFSRALLLPLLAVMLLFACQPQPVQVFIEVDGGRQSLTTRASTVRAALAEANVTLGPLDRVNPDLYSELESGLVIRVIRVSEEIVTEREGVPFEQQTVINEALAAGETRLAQAGVNGEDEVSTRIVYEDGVEVSRTEISRVTVIQPSPEILVIGPRGQLSPVPLEGTIAYLSGGNAWLMRDSSGSRRPLTTGGDLDGRVFSLSGDGRYLLYTRKITDNLDLPLNELELAPTTIVGEASISLGLSGILQAEWSPVISQSVVAYSTAERTANAPGWRANNDLWLLTLSQGRPAGRPVELVPANTQGLYPWWGASFTWSPGGGQLAYARPDQIGLVSLQEGNTRRATTAGLVDFAPLKTFSEWVWVPGLSWSPDERFIAATVHGQPLAAEPAEESPAFDLWLLGLDGQTAIPVVKQVGMWANPVWGADGIAYGQALNSLESASSRYSIQVMDRDGSNRRQLFPFREEPGVEFPELAWLPGGQQLLFIYNGNLYVVDSRGGPPRQLTSDGQASRISWAAEAPPLTDTGAITTTTAVTNDTSLPPADAAPTGAVTSTVTGTTTALPTLTVPPAPTPGPQPVSPLPGPPPRDTLPIEEGSEP